MDIYTFHSHVNHNPDCDILIEQIDRNTIISYGVYVNGPKTGEEFMEYYSGPNYVDDPSGSNQAEQNYSRCYSVDRIPKRWRLEWEALKVMYQAEYLLTSNLVS